MAPCQRLRLGILLGTGLILGILFSGSAMLLERSRQTALNAAGASVQNAALVVENTINRQLLQVDGALASLPALFATVAGQTGELDQQSATRLLQSVNFGTFAFRDLLLVRPDGTIWSAARPRPGSQSHSRLSSLQRMARPGAVAVDGPVRNRLTGDWSWFLARPITLPGIGELQVVAEVPVAFITTLLAPVGEIPGLRIDIVRPDGALLASLPHDEGRIGKPAAPARRDAKAAKRAGIIAISRPTLYPDVKVALTLELSTAMADWVRDRNRALAAIAGAGVLVLALAAALFAAMRQREWVEIERMRSRQILDDAIESMADGFVMWDEQDRLITCNQRFRDMYAISAPFMQPGALFEDVMIRGVALGQYPQAGDNREQFVRDIVEWHHSNHGAIERLLPDGRWMLVTERHTPSGGTVGIRTDITALKAALNDLAAANIRATQAIADVQIQNAALTERDFALRTQNMLFDAALNNMSQGLLMVDSDRRLIVCNKRFLEIFEIAPEAASPGMTTAALFHAVETAGGLTPIRLNIDTCPVPVPD
jgi:PAS domain-containing protein